MAGAIARMLGREPREHTLLDFAVLCAASYKAARTIARGANDFLQAAFAALRAKANSLEQQRG